MVCYSLPGGGGSLTLLGYKTQSGKCRSTNSENIMGRVYKCFPPKIKSLLYAPPPGNRDGGERRNGYGDKTENECSMGKLEEEVH